MNPYLYGESLAGAGNPSLFADLASPSSDEMFRKALQSRAWAVAPEVRASAASGGGNAAPAPTGSFLTSFLSMLRDIEPTSKSSMRATPSALTPMDQFIQYLMSVQAR